MSRGAAIRRQRDSASRGTRGERLPLTPKQKAVVDYVATHWRQWQRGPSLAEVAKYMDHRSLGTTHELVSLLLRRGWLEWPMLNYTHAAFGLRVARSAISSPNSTV